MIDYQKILKRAWNILWDYKVLWIFGLLLAMVTGGGGSNGGASYSVDGSGSGEKVQYNPQFVEEMNHWFEQNVEPLVATEQQVIHTLIWLGIGLAIFILLVSLLVALVRYPSEAAVIRMVDEYEQNGTKAGFKQGWKLGWSRRAFRMWVIDLIVNLPVILLIGFLVGTGFAVYYSVRSGNEPASVAGIVASIGGLFLFIFVFCLGMVFLSLLRQFFWRAAALEETGVMESFRRGWELFKSNWKSAGMMWLIMLGLGLGFSIAVIIVFIPLLILCIVPAIAGIIAGAIPGLLFGWIVSLFAPTWVAVVVGIVIFMPLFGLVTFSPFLLVAGWMKVFESSVWTLTYREIKALQGLVPENLPELAK